jgi:hypothetical protein
MLASPMPGASEEDIMKNTNLLAILAVLGTTTTTAAVALSGCSSSSGNETAGDASTSDVTTGDDSGGDSATGDTGSPGTDGGAEAEAAAPPPAPPTLGTLIDRMGRPAVNTALNHVFDPACAAPNLCTAKDTYNTDGTPSDWNTNWAPQFYQNLAIFDALDTVCGNQAGYNAMLLGTTYPAYTALAGVLAQDALWVNTSSTTCNQYLAVELATLSGTAPTDCGGRTLTENTIDETYNLLAGTYAPNPDAGTFGPATNGITAPASAPSATFPYFAAPH